MKPDRGLTQGPIKRLSVFVVDQELQVGSIKKLILETEGRSAKNIGM